MTSERRGLRVGPSKAQSQRRSEDETLAKSLKVEIWVSTQLVTLAAQNSHPKIAVTTVAASGLATIPLQKSYGCGFAGHEISQWLAILGLPSNRSQRPRPQVAAAARFCGCSDHGTLRF